MFFLFGPSLEVVTEGRIFQTGIFPDLFSRKLVKLLFPVMLSVARPSFEVVREGRILDAGLLAIPTIHLQFDFGLFWLILDPDLAEVHYFSAMIAHLMEWDWEKSEKEFLMALAINPNDSVSRIIYSQLLAVLQRNDEALAQGKLAYSLDPLNPNMKIWYAATLMAPGDFKTGLSLLEEVVAVDPGNYMANSAITMAAYRTKEYDKVIRAEKYLLPLLIGENAFKEIERIYSEHDITLAYIEIMKYLEEFAQNNPISPIDMAYRYITANQPDKAMDCIEKGFEIHDPVMIYIATMMFNLDQLFKNPRFIAICKKMNLPLPKSN